MLHKVALSNYDTLPPYKQARVKVVTKTSVLIYKKPSHSLRTGCFVRPVDVIYVVVANNPFQVFFTNFSAVEK